jgi:hypothetical protein
MTQTQYGFARTVCACAACQEFCGTLSGMVSPADLERWREDGRETGHNTEQWLLNAFAASPGALVGQAGIVRRIPTIVPRRRATGACIFYLNGPHQHGQCAMHETAPYGCSHFDSHMSRAEADPRSLRALEAIAADFVQGGPYSQLWQALHDAGHVVEGPEAARRHLRNP